MRQRYILVEGKPKVISQENGRKVMAPTALEEMGRKKGCCSATNDLCM